MGRRSAGDVCGEGGGVGEGPATASDGLPLREGGGFRFRSRLERNIVRRVGQAVADFGLIRNGDRVLVAMSGGKDSYALLDVLLQLRKRAPIDFELVAATVDAGWPGIETEAIGRWARSQGVEHHVERLDFRRIIDRVLKPGVSPCSLCSRLRRGILYGMATKLGCQALALGHNLDDLCESLLLNLFYTGRLRTLPPRLVSDDGRNVVIRPLCYVREAEIKEYAASRGYPRGGACGYAEEHPDARRQAIKKLLAEVERESPELKYQMLAAMTRVVPTHLLDRELLARLGGMPKKG